MAAFFYVLSNGAWHIKTAMHDVILSCYLLNIQAHFFLGLNILRDRAHDMLSRLRKKPIQAGPAFARTLYKSREQVAFYQRLRCAVPNCIFFPDIELSALLKPLASDARLLRQQREQLDGRCLAYGVFNEMLELLCVIELNGFGVQHAERALTLSILEQAGIACFSWDHDNLPSHDQIVRAMSAFTDIVPSRFEPAANSTLVPDAPTWENVVSSKRPAAFSLSVDDVYRLTPNGNVRAMHPHIWERICLFCHEPRQFEQYLSSLSLQDRGDARAGFPQAVIVELTDLQSANARYMPVQPRVRAGWNDIFINR